MVQEAQFEKFCHELTNPSVTANVTHTKPGSSNNNVLGDCDPNVNAPSVEHGVY